MAQPATQKKIMVYPRQTSQLSPPSPQAAREVRRNSPVRQARTCYHHLAGVAGVTLMEAMLQQGWLEVGEEAKRRTHFRLTLSGHHALSNRGVSLSAEKSSRRMYAYGCLDWTERCFHLGGALGASILDALLEAGVVQRQRGNRVVTLLEPLDTWIDSDAG